MNLICIFLYHSPKLLSQLYSYSGFGKFSTLWLVGAVRISAPPSHHQFQSLNNIIPVIINVNAVILVIVILWRGSPKRKMAFKTPFVPRELKYRILSMFQCETPYKPQFYSLYYPFLGSTDVSGSNDSSTLIRDFMAFFVVQCYLVLLQKTLFFLIHGPKITLS